MSSWIENIAAYIEDNSIGVNTEGISMPKMVLTENLFLHASPESETRSDLVVIYSDGEHYTPGPGDPRKCPAMFIVAFGATFRAAELRVQEVTGIIYGNRGEKSVFYAPDDESPVIHVQTYPDGDIERIGVHSDGTRRIVQQKYNVTYVPLT